MVTRVELLIRDFSAIMKSPMHFYIELIHETHLIRISAQITNCTRLCNWNRSVYVILRRHASNFSHFQFLLLHFFHSTIRWHTHISSCTLKFSFTYHRSQVNFDKNNAELFLSPFASLSAIRASLKSTFSDNSFLPFILLLFHFVFLSCFYCFIWALQNDMITYFNVIYFTFYRLFTFFCFDSSNKVKFKTKSLVNKCIVFCCRFID